MNTDLIKKAVADLSCEPAAIAAVMEIESSGGGMLPPHPETGERRAIVRFEGATFHRLTSGRFDSVRPDLSMDSWRDNAKHVRGGWGEWDRIRDAAALDEPAAYESASYGAFQIMGCHWSRLGYKSVEAFVADMDAGEAGQMHAFVLFIQSDRVLLDAIQNHKWRAFARRYNGSGQVDAYADKLSKAYQRHKG